jgi:hypothetical protein
MNGDRGGRNQPTVESGFGNGGFTGEETHHSALFISASQLSQFQLFLREVSPCKRFSASTSACKSVSLGHDSGLFHFRLRRCCLNHFLLLTRNKFVIPIRVTRPAVASKAHSILPILSTLGTHTAGVECVPDAAARGLANPAIGRLRDPLALRAKDFDLSHRVQSFNL